jgi:hypothetical protein
MFHGHLTAAQANEILANKKRGSFLIRASEQTHDHLVIAYVSQTRDIRNVLVEQVAQTPSSTPTSPLPSCASAAASISFRVHGEDVLFSSLQDIVRRFSDDLKVHHSIDCGAIVLRY